MFDRFFRRLCYFFAAFTIVLIVLLVVEIGAKAVSAFREYGLSFLWGRTWDPNKGVFGILPEIWGTLYTSLVGPLFWDPLRGRGRVVPQRGLSGRSCFQASQGVQPPLPSGVGTALWSGWKPC